MKKAVTAVLTCMVLVFCASGCVAGEEPATSPGAQSVQGEGSAVEASGSSEESEPEREATSPPEESEESVPEEEPPDNSWQFDAPENHGMDPGLLERLHSALADVEIRSVVVVKDGFIVDEYYKEGYDENHVFGLASCTKSVSGALIGLAIEQGLISGVDARLTEFFPQLLESDDPRRLDITVEHLLTHTSGIYWSEWSGGTMFGQLSRSENWVEFVLGQDMASQPGAVFNYTTGGSHLLGAVIQKAAGVTAYEFGVENLFKHLGMDSVLWRSDPQGITDGGNGISMTARDAAKFGQLYLDGGMWKGRQIIPKEWVELSTAWQAAGSPGTGEYGYSWWLKRFGNAAYSTYYAMGHAGQYIFVVPELKLVTVMTSRLNDTYAPQYYFNDYVIAACG